MRRRPCLLSTPTLLLCGLLCFSLSCSGLPMEPVDVSTLKVRPPQLMVARKAKDTLYIQLDPAEVPDSATVQTEGMKPIEVRNIRSFVRTHLASEMEDRFSKVVVVSPGETIQAPSWFAKVSVTEVGAILDAVAGYQTNASRVFGTLNWSFALMRTGADDFIFSYAGESQGSNPLVHVSQTSEMYASTFEAALADMLKAYTDKGIQQKVLEAEAPEPATQETPAAEPVGSSE